jgi:hypothetical protein
MAGRVPDRALRLVGSLQRASRPARVRLSCVGVSGSAASARLPSAVRRPLGVPHRAKGRGPAFVRGTYDAFVAALPI